MCRDCGRKSVRRDPECPALCGLREAQAETQASWEESDRLRKKVYELEAQIKILSKSVSSKTSRHNPAGTKKKK